MLKLSLVFIVTTGVLNRWLKATYLQRCSIKPSPACWELSIPQCVFVGWHAAVERQQERWCSAVFCPSVSAVLNIITALLSPQQPTRPHPQKGFCLGIYWLSLCMCVCVCGRRMLADVNVHHTGQTVNHCSPHVNKNTAWPLSEWINHTIHYSASYQTISFINTPLHHARPSSSRPTVLSVFPRTRPHDARADWRFNNTKRFTAAPTHLPR